jgi:RNA 2',3'-cyclic 3'-phosphodiesterase
MRLFLALDLNDAARAKVAAVARELAENLERAREPRAVKWVERENLHVTLRFLGEVTDETAAALQQVLSAPLPVKPFTLRVGGAGCFPPSGDPRIVWVGITEGADDARAVYQHLDVRLRPLDFASEAREYRPHVTLGRVRDLSRPVGRNLRVWLHGVPSRLGEVAIEDVTLYRSQLSSRGPRYEALMRTGLSS